MDKEVMNEMDERYVKRSEFMNSISKLEKDVSTIKMMLIFIAVSSASPLLQTILQYVVK